VLEETYTVSYLTLAVKLVEYFLRESFLIPWSNVGVEKMKIGYSRNHPKYGA
jgi:hypothetical protein